MLQFLRQTEKKVADTTAGAPHYLIGGEHMTLNYIGQ